MTANATTRGSRGRRSSTALGIAGILIAASSGFVRADFDYPNFNSVVGLTLNGDAAQSGSVLVVAPNLEGQAGSAWRTTAKAHLSAGFDTTFTFRMATDGADGMAFVIQDDATTALGSGGSGLGFEGIPRSLAVEIDTFGFFPESDNHVSVQTRGALENDYQDAYSLAQYNVAQDLNDGSTHSITIRYRPGFLLVFLDGGNAPIINLSLDLTNINGDNILDGSGDAWVGFTAGTGGVFQAHEVHNWNFDETGDPLPAGACCTISGCVASNARDCGVSIAGHYAGDGTDCGTVDCSGACCYIDGCFWPATIQNCAAEPGTFMGVGSTCPQVSCSGACCTPFGECLLTDQASCVNFEQGMFHGPGSSCVPFPCSLPSMGACCDVTNECLMQTQAECATANGTWWGQATNCDDVNCFDDPPPFGACCQPGGVCVENVAQLACEHFNGVYNGDDSVCALANCIAACDCLSATPLNGTVFLNDTTTGAPGCTGITCGAAMGSSPARIYALTVPLGGQVLINTCNGADFDTVITVHSGCPMTQENLVSCDDNAACGPASQVFFCAEPAVTYYVRVGGVNGASGNFTLLVVDFGSRILEGPIQNPANGHWYYMTAHGTWINNEALAVSKGGHLVTINDAAENEWVRSTFTPVNNNGLIIGINDAATEGTFVWPNGEPVTYTNWEPGQPVDNNGNEDYGFLRTDGAWANQINCPFYNSGEAVIEVETLTLPGIVTGPLMRPGSCNSYFLTEAGTWIEAQLKAQSMGGNLVTINDVDENEFVRTMLANHGGHGQVVWIGLRDTVTEGTFVWADGSPLGYTNWTPGEPNNIGNEDYVILLDYVPGQWNDVQNSGPFRGVIEVPGSCIPVGDMNCSGSVTTADIPIFIAVLLGNPGAPGCPITNADVNGDALINGRDVKPFVALLVP